ncbi:MAG: transcription termination factor NusA [Armatimonadetes bacterium]|nr:transcription termination factor NusA [Armatimonadota bacterium]MCX7968396.1 transcription termination factor NusA [Armatimonadota bacterium]MDW8142278.1 transcription termination factor NusA [Armatimonadota bacterium]
MSAELVALVQQIAKDKELPLEEVLGAMCDGIRHAYEKQFMRDMGRYQRKRVRPRVVAVLDLENKVLRLALEKTVVENPTNYHLEISLEEARKIDPDAQLGMRVRVDLPLSEFSRAAMQLARQRMQERIREIEQKRVYELYKDKVNTVVVGQVARWDSHGNIYLTLDRAEALLPRREQVPTESFQKGERVRVYIYEIRKPTGSTEPILLVSRTHKELLRKLLEAEVPEIREGVVEIKALVRDPGYRSKVAVASKDPSIDPVGACVGQQSKRINNITQELRGERVDIIEWNPDEAKFIMNALSPAKAETIIMNFDERTATVVVSEDQLSLAIGKQGRNVSLAARLTGWRIDIRTESQLGREVPFAETVTAQIGKEEVSVELNASNAESQMEEDLTAEGEGAVESSVEAEATEGR